MTTLKPDYPDLLVTDAHVHLWDLTKMTYPWLAEIPALNQSFGLTEYQSATKGIPISNILFMQCECLPGEYQTEVDYVTQLATADARIRGIIAYFPLDADNAADILETFTANKLIKGLRRQEEEPTSLYRNPHFTANMSLLNRHNLRFDLGVKAAHQLPAVLDLVQAAPDVHYMLDHVGKPTIRTKAFAQWQHQLKELASNPKIYCKLSGLVTEADWERWTVTDLQPYMEVALEYFGPGRLVFGGDWPVVTLASTYRHWFDTALQLCAALSSNDLRRVFHQNALDFYQIDACE